MPSKDSSAIEAIIDNGSLLEKKALFQFDATDSDEAVLLKFNLWARYFFPAYFSSPDAEFHEDIDTYNLWVYRGKLRNFVDIAFRGSGKTARTKLFRGFVLANDIDRTRRFLKVLSEDADNAKQIVTDVYNMLVTPRVSQMYPELFAKTIQKREERMSVFTTATGIKVLADTVGTGQRGALQEEARPDEIWFEDFENKKTLRSAKVSFAIWENMEEARTGLSVGGSCVYTCNYTSEAGNVHKLVERYKKAGDSKVVIIPIVSDNGSLAWPERYSAAAVAVMRAEDDDFEGERLCKPSASSEIMFDRDALDQQKAIQPIRTTGGFKIYREFDASHRYGSGHDVAGGVGLDSSTSAFIDFSLNPSQVVGTFKSNKIKPDTFGDEIAREVDFFPKTVVGVEKNNHGHATIARAKQLDLDLCLTEGKQTRLDDTTPKEYGWHTNALTKPRMIYDLVKAVNDGLLILNDEDLIDECKGYTRNDLIENESDPRLTTRHFDLLIALAIAWQMRNNTRQKESVDRADREMERQMKKTASSILR